MKQVAMAEKLVEITSESGETIQTTLKAASLSVFIKGMIENTGQDVESSEPIQIPIVTISSAVLKKIVEWMNQWQDTEQPTKEVLTARTEKYDEEIDAWNESFLRPMTLLELCHLVNGANFLDIPYLFWLTCREIASKGIKGKSAEEIRQCFGIVCDFTPEELAQIELENKWCEPV